MNRRFINQTCVDCGESFDADRFLDLCMKCAGSREAALQSDAIDLKNISFRAQFEKLSVADCVKLQSIADTLDRYAREHANSYTGYSRRNILRFELRGLTELLMDENF